MPHARLRVLLNAEPFGFGPSAAVAAFAAELRPAVGWLGYAGCGHTLDLQRSIPYDAIHAMDGESDWGRVMGDYHLLVTACDDRVAEMALEAGLPVVFYDALTWYWPSLPASATRCRYIAQDFFGVGERLAREAGHFADCHMVPPLADPAPARRDGDFAVLNLGGLENPLWEPHVAPDYAMAVVSAVQSVMPAGLRLEIAANRRVSTAVGAPNMRPRPANEMEDLLSRCRFSLSTPGLGNIYDAAVSSLPTLWLPPANDSQGQQLAHLRERGLVDGMDCDWAALGRPLDYLRPQSVVMAALAAEVYWLGTADGQAALSRLMSPAVAALSKGAGPISPLSVLATHFGRGGAARVARLVLDLALERVPRPSGDGGSR